MAREIDLPQPHADQIRAFEAPGRFKAIRCGRRWGKTTFGEIIACDAAIGPDGGVGENVGYFTPTYKLQTEVFNDIASLLRPAKLTSSKVDGVIRTVTGGRIDFWTLENEDAGRSRNYHKVIIDEAAFAKPNMMGIWERAIMPTLLDHQGVAYVLSNTNGKDPDNFFYQICTEPKHGFTEFWAPTHNNPDMPRRRWRESEEEYQARRAAEFEDLKKKRHPLAYQQEYLAEFVSWLGIPIFAEESLLVDGQPVQFPEWCEQVGLVIDTAVKGGKEHDATAALWYAYTDPIRHPKYPLVVLDWGLVQIDGALLENLLPQWLAHGETLARECKALHGFTGGWIEDAAAGSILLQQAQSRGWPVEALPSVLTAAGKDARALNASGPVYRGEVKISDRAFHKTALFKDHERNHLWSQVTGFFVGDKAAAARADDLLDDFTYMVAVTLGDQEGIA